MYLTVTNMIAMMIVLSINLFMLGIILYANTRLVKENRYLRRRTRRYREACRNHVEVPF